MVFLSPVTQFVYGKASTAGRRKSWNAHAIYKQNIHRLFMSGCCHPFAL